ncbi:nucleoside 5-triphosphatase RdgB (dHAPTP, dITP,XTP-specific) [Campylobacter jejuni]|nr:nucleoside 5-triphosphatase RdgB (dHAPTP, dITP,XTP-specific) [Campylobacter jejuni]
MSKKEEIKKIKLDVFNENGNFLGVKYFYNDKKESINKWLRTFNKKDGNNIGVLMADAPDFQQNNHIAILNKKRNVHLIFQDINENIINIAIYFSVRHIIEHTYINHNDQFLYPNDLYKNDNEFKSDCLSFMLFHGKNRISAKEGINHFIPFSEKELGITKEAFKSDFMYKFIKGNIKDENSLFGDELAKIEFSPQANELLKAGKELFKYYHTHSEDKNYLANASLYDIKEFFQGRDEKGRMKLPSQAKDEHYKALLSDLNANLKILAKKLEPKIYEYGFLKE